MFEMTYDTLLRDVKKDASPGMPFMSAAMQTNKQVLEKYGALVKGAVLERLELLASEDIVGKLDPVDLVAGGYCDPVRVFVKGEPHNQLKVSQGRLRLISSVSLVDQLVERFLYCKQNKAEIDAWESIPSKPGLGLNDESLLSIHNQVESWRSQGEIYEADISGWDFGMQEWELLWEADMRARLAGMVGTVYHRILRNRVWCEGTTLFMLSNGKFLAQLKHGKRCSGSYNTSAGNSRVRVMLGYLLGAKHIIAMGDDSVECFAGDSKPDIAGYESMGHIVKNYAHSRVVFEFCSTRIYKDSKDQIRGEPVNWSRTMYRLMFAKDKHIERLSQFQYEMRHSPNLEPCLNILHEVGWMPQLDAKENSEGQGESQTQGEE